MKKNTSNEVEYKKLMNNIIIDKEIVKEINSNTLFLNFIKESELGIRDFIKNINIDFRFNFIIRKDFEIREWEKIILNITPINDDLDFDTRITMWDEIDEKIRKRLKSLMERCSERDKRTIQDINKRFFIEMNL